MTGRAALQAIIADNLSGKARGIPSWCTAHAPTLMAVLQAHRNGAEPILIEATCNQVNHRGGYTGMTPADFAAFIAALAARAGVDRARIILGGDHLGPNPWRHLAAADAMAEAQTMVRAYVAAGFEKIHLDASMACADDRTLSEEEMAARAAELCAVAEAARGAREIVYVIGTEVPIPGGERQMLDGLAVTRPEAAIRTYELHRSAFAKRGLDSALARAVGLVVQPGVDMGNEQVFAYDRAKAAALSAAVRDIPGLVYEAHTTDYQTEAALSALVADHFAILKVGPALTFAFRESVVAMAAIEHQLKKSDRSGILAAIAAAMNKNPVHWRGYVAADERQDMMKLYGLSDRVRYYWTDPAIASALEKLIGNIDSLDAPLGLVSQFVGCMLPVDPAVRLSERIIQTKVGTEVAKYRAACGAMARPA